MITDAIAVATVSGKAYYMIVSELKKRRIGFLSLSPGDAIPLDVRIVITTASERDKIHFPNVLIYDDFPDPEILVEQALLILQGKNRYREVIVGVDPGKRFGIAVTGDGKVLKVLITSNIDETTKSIIKLLEIVGGDRRIVRIGNGAREYQIALAESLDESLPSDVLMESVEEYRTTKASKRSSNWRKDLRDGFSAIEISMRNGKIIKRKEKSEHTCGEGKSPPSERPSFGYDIRREGDSLWS